MPRSRENKNICPAPYPLNFPIESRLFLLFLNESGITNLSPHWIKSRTTSASSALVSSGLNGMPYSKEASVPTIERPLSRVDREAVIAMEMGGTL